MNPLRILVLAPGSNPDSISTALVGYAHSEALARLHAVIVVVNERHEAAIRRKSAAFRGIEAVSTPWLDYLFDWLIQRIFKGDYGSQVLTALGYPFLLVFEWKAWQRLRRRIKAGEFDVVLRLLPVVPTLPSMFPFLLRRLSVPFVIGPLNGGLPWPEGFTQAAKQKEWIACLRSLYRFMPFSRSTYRRASAIITGSSQTYSEFASHREKLFFVPENGLSRVLLDSATPRGQRNGKLELIYVGRLVPYKAPDIAVRAAAGLVRQGLSTLTIVGDGPERAGLGQLADTLGIAKGVSFVGWLDHGETLQTIQKADVLIFPSIREFGGGVVFEALALGVVPVVVDYGGPGDIVTAKVGYKVALTNEQDMIAQIEKILISLEGNRSLLAQLQEQGMIYARENLSWDGKALAVTQILNWATGRGPKPELMPPKVLSSVYS